MSGGPTAQAGELPRLLLALVDELRHQPQRMLRDGSLSRRTVERLLAALGLTAERGWAEGQAVRFLHWLLALGHAAALIAEREGQLEVLPEGASAFFHKPAADRTRLLLMAWQRAGDPAPPSVPAPDVVAPLPAPTAAAADAPPLLAPPPAAEHGLRGSGTPLKRKALRLLAKLLRQGTPTSTALFEELQRLPERGGPPAERATVHELLAELVPLGVLEPGPWEQRGELVVSADGAFALGTGGRPAGGAAHAGHLIVQPTFSVVVVTDPDDLGLPYEVGRFARPEGPPPSFSYRISARSALRAAREGLSLEGVVGLLQRLCPHPLPQNVVHSLGEWRAAQARLFVRRGVTLVEVTDPAELEELLPFAELTRGVRRLSPTLLLVPARERSEVVQVLGTNEFFDLDYQGRLPPCLELGPELQLQPLESCTSLWTPLLLQRYADDAGAPGRYRLDPRRIGAAAAGQGAAGVDVVRRELERAIIGGLPPEVELVLRAATGHQGTLHLVHSPVLCVEDPLELEAVLRVPVVRAALVRRLGPTAALLRRDSGPGVVERLSALGLSVRGDVPPARGPAPPEEEETVAEPTAILGRLRDAASRGEEVVLTYDPGARRPLEEVRVIARELSCRKGRHYLHALRPGQTEERVFSLSYVTSVRRVLRGG